MIDTTKLRGRIIEAALHLAKDTDWHDVTMDRIAGKADISLAELSTEFSSRSAILRAFVNAVDAATIAAAAKEIEPGQPARDRLFAVIMARFDILDTYKPALKRMACRPDLLLDMPCTAIKSQRWMLEAAGLSPNGPNGRVRIAGLTAIYGDVFRIWLGDDSDGLDKTMARLDRDLRCGERIICGVRTTLCNARRILCRFIPKRSGSTSPSDAPPQPDGNNDNLNVEPQPNPA